jgi:hypothetical protein
MQKGELMTSRELLELAAKAARIEYQRADDGEVLEYFGGGLQLAFGDKWNPLTDDGDALRLAVRLGLYVNVYLTPTNKTNVGGAKLLTSEDHNSDPDAATRLAIVRAAAEIGKAMP